MQVLTVEIIRLIQTNLCQKNVTEITRAFFNDTRVHGQEDKITLYLLSAKTEKNKNFQEVIDQEEKEEPRKTERINK